MSIPDFIVMRGIFTVNDRDRVMIWGIRDFCSLLYPEIENLILMLIVVWKMVERRGFNAN